MAAPVRKGEELELRIDSLAYGGNGVARHDGFVVFARGGLPGDTVRVPRDEGEARASPRGSSRSSSTPSKSRVDGAVPALRRLRRVPLPGPRLRRAARREGAAGARRARADRAVRRSRRSSRSFRPQSQFGYRNKLEYSFTAGEDGVDLGFHRAGRWDEVVGHRGVPAHDRRSATRFGSPCAEWAREERLEPYDQETGSGISPPPRRAGGA